jgi:hypothetical protein
MGPTPLDLGGVVMKVTPEMVATWVERSCAAQGVPVKVRDPEVVAQVATLLGQVRQTASMRSGSKLDRPRTAGRMVARSRTADTIER